jgi:hypothetical protein
MQVSAAFAGRLETLHYLAGGARGTAPWGMARCLRAASRVNVPGLAGRKSLHSLGVVEIGGRDWLAGMKLAADEQGRRSKRRGASSEQRSGWRAALAGFGSHLGRQPTPNEDQIQRAFSEPGGQTDTGFCPQQPHCELHDA